MFRPVLFPGLIELYQRDDVRRVHAAQRPVAVAARNDLVVRAQNKFGRLDQTAAFFMIGADQIAGFLCDAVANWKGNVIGDFLRLVEGIDACSDDRGVQSLEFINLVFEAD